MKALLVIILAGCGAEPAVGSQGSAGPQRTGCAAGELVVGDACVSTPALSADALDRLDRQAARLAAVAKQLAATEPIEQASQALGAAHQLDRWKRQAAAAKFAVVDIAASLHEAANKMHALGGKLDAAARELTALRTDLAAIAKQPGRRTLVEVRELVSARIAAWVAPLGEAIGEAVPDLYVHYEEPILDEIVFVNERLCAKDDPTLLEVCTHVAASTAREYIEKTRGAARHEFDEVGRELEIRLAQLLDVRAATAIDRATGRGPTYGQPCGPDGLCESRLTCAPSQTCEAWCREEAEQPCPGGTHCTTVAGLDRQVCRP